MINILKNSPPPHLASALSLALRPLFLFLPPFLADGTAKVETLSDFPKTFLKFFLFFLSGNKKKLNHLFLTLFYPLFKRSVELLSLAEWCKDREFKPLLPNIFNLFFNP